MGNLEKVSLDLEINIKSDKLMILNCISLSLAALFNLLTTYLLWSSK